MSAMSRIPRRDDNDTCDAVRSALRRSSRTKDFKKEEEARSARNRNSTGLLVPELGSASRRSSGSRNSSKNRGDSTDSQCTSVLTRMSTCAVQHDLLDLLDDEEGHHAHARVPSRNAVETPVEVRSAMMRKSLTCAHDPGLSPSPEPSGALAPVEIRSAMARMQTRVDLAESHEHDKRASSVTSKRSSLDLPPSRGGSRRPSRNMEENGTCPPEIRSARQRHQGSVSRGHSPETAVKKSPPGSHGGSKTPSENGDRLSVAITGGDFARDGLAWELLHSCLALRESASELPGVPWDEAGSNERNLVRALASITSGIEHHDLDDVPPAIEPKLRLEQPDENSALHEAPTRQSMRSFPRLLTALRNSICTKSVEAQSAPVESYDKKAGKAMVNYGNDVFQIVPGSPLAKESSTAKSSTSFMGKMAGMFGRSSKDGVKDSKASKAMGG